jgi:predicted transcriptional regulator
MARAETAAGSPTTTECVVAAPVPPDHHTATVLNTVETEFGAMQVRSVMRTDPVTVPANTSLWLTVREMLVHHAEYVVVTDGEGDPRGVLDQHDVLHALYQADPPPTEIRVLNVARSPRLTLSPSATLRKAVRRLTYKDTAVAPVTRDLDVVGVVSLLDIAGHHKVSLSERDDEADLRR